MYKYRPHTETVIKLYSHPASSGILHSVSYDGTIRTLDMSHSAFISSFEAPESLSEMIFTDAAVSHGSYSSAIVSRSDGFVALVDFRQSNNSYSWKVGEHV